MPVSTPRRTRALAAIAALTTALTSLAVGLSALPAGATNITAVTVSGGTGTYTDTTVTPNRVYARSTQIVTFNVTTDTTTACVIVTDAGGSVLATDKTGRTSLSFPITAGPGNGTQTLTFTGYKNVNNGNGSCTSTTATRTAAYVLDNTGPTVTPVLAPVPNAAGWNHQNTTVTWTAADPNADPSTPGSGVPSQPTGSTSYQQNGVYALTAPAGVIDRVGNAGTGSGILRLDKAAPTISGSRTPAPNGFGWNNVPVTASFACSDNPASDASGLAAPGCPAATVLGSATDPSKDVTNASVTGAVSDVAGNSASDTVSGVNVDTVNPTLSGTPATAANADNWYRGNVTIHWTAADGRSGVDPATAPGDSVISSEGSALTASASVNDKAGNTRSATSSPVNIDKTAPQTGIAGTSNSWTNGNVTVTLSPTDALSGVASTTYSVGGGATQIGTAFTLASEGDHVVTYSSTDRAGNTEALRTAHVKIDKTAPAIAHGFTPSSYDGGWSNATVTVTFTCTDGGSGVATCTAPADVTAEGANQHVLGTAADNAGNSASDIATVNIDRTPPTVSATADRAANGDGWYDGDVTVSFSCADQAALSGIKSCPASRTMGEGKDQTASGTATDNADNSTTGAVTGVNVDQTPPILSGVVTTPPNVNNWYDNSVVVAWSCSDALSGINGACPSNSTVNGEGSNLGASASVSDKAGNAKTASVSGIRIDTTAPVTTSSVSAPLATGWYADKVHVTLSGADNLSGVDATYYTVDGGATKTYSAAFDFATPGIHAITFWSRDNAGNVEDPGGPGHVVTVQVDGIKPTISGGSSPVPNAAGWNNSDVTVAFDCSDAESGIASCLGDTTLTTDAANQFVTGTATDHGGNSDTATVGPINLDQTPPAAKGTTTTPPNENGWFNGDVRVHWTASDSTSGVDESTLPGDTRLTGEGADLTAGPVYVQDVAGNTGTGSVQHLRIDRTAPVVTGTPTAAPNATNWYHTDVTVTWTCSDDLSGVAAGDCPADSTLSGEGSNLSTSSSVSDRAGNAAAGSVSGIRIDRTPPSTDISAASAWTNTDATVTFSATDNLSGIAATHYTVDGGAEQTGTEVTFSDEGVYDLDVWSVDAAGNVEAHKSARVRIDKSAPTITHVQQPLANVNGWNNTDVRIAFSCNDTGGSGIKSCSDPIVETHEGKDQPEPGTATDNAGNAATDPATVSIDKSAPTISASADRPANDNDWYDGDVTVTFTCEDQLGLSGIKSCSAPVTLGEGAAQSASGTAADAAGNGASTTLSGVNVDETAPSLSGAAMTAPNAAGWYDSDVVVAWSCADQEGLSGIDGTCPKDSTVTGEGDDLGASAQVADRAGNITTAAVHGLHIDRTPAVTSAVLPPADSNIGWYKSGPTVSLVATDTLSAVAATYYTVDGGAAHHYAGAFTEGLEGVHTVQFWSVDKAGNVEDAAGTGNAVVIRVDTTRATIVGSRQPAANGRGWNNEPVVASFACTDIGGSGVDTCTDPVTLSTEGADQSVKGQATDKVGNASAATVAGISIDLTSPSLSGAATTQPNSDGWYKGDVDIAWTCSDALSGIVGGCPAASTITGEGDNLSATESVRDNADNATQANVDDIQIDRHGPVTSVSAPSDWQTSGVALDITATDNLSGVKATYFTVNGGPTHTGNKIELSADGTYSLAFWSVDKADNEGTHGSASVRIDQSAPTITHTIKPEPNSDLWNNSDATVEFLCSDQTSGVKSCAGDSVVTTEAANQTVIGAAVDNAGNSSTDTAMVSLDRTKPTISGTPDRQANANGWYDDDVTVTFTCGDNLSGVVDCGKDVTLAEGSDQSASGSVSDKAGNSRSVTVTGINVDKTAPVLTGAVTTPRSGGSFYDGNVTVHWTCSDQLSGIGGACPADSTVSGQGMNLAASASVADKAGNARTTTVSGINIDRTAPVTTLSAPDPTYASGWYGAPVTVRLAGTDNLSGVARTYYTVDGGAAATYGAPFSVGKGIHTVIFWSTDVAGNAESTATEHTATFKVDNLPPSIEGAATTSPNGNGWYAGPVTVHFTCSDAESVVAKCAADQTISGDGANQFVTGSATDVAGNSATAKVGPLNIDQTKPTFAAYTGGTSFTLGQTVTSPTCNASDALSGLAGCSLVKSGGGLTNTNGVGDVNYAFTATDRAGNTATQTVTVHVGYAWSGFLQPVTNTAHDLTTASTFKAGSTVPMKFQLKDSSGTVRQATYMPAWLQPVDLGTTATGAGVATNGNGTVGGSFKADGQQYVFTWQTPKTGAGHYYRVGVQLDSGDVYTVLIKLS